MKFAIFLKSSLLFNSLYCFLFINKTLRFNNLKTTRAVNAKISVLVIGAEAIIYLLLYNLHDCTFKDYCLLSVHVCSFDNFTVLNYESHKFKRLIKESFLVTKDKPLLNKQVKSLKLELY